MYVLVDEGADDDFFVVDEPEEDPDELGGPDAAGVLEAPEELGLLLVVEPVAAASELVEVW